MTQFLGALLLTGVLGYIPYKYLTMIGLVSEKTRLSILLYYWFFLLKHVWYGFIVL